MQDKLVAYEALPRFIHELTGAYVPNPQRKWSFWAQKLAHWFLKRYGQAHQLTTTVYTYEKTTPELEQAIFQNAKALGAFCGYDTKFEVVMGRDTFEKFMRAKAPNMWLNWETKVRYKHSGYSGVTIMNMPVFFYPHIEGFAVLPLQVYD